MRCAFQNAGWAVAFPGKLREEMVLPAIVNVFAVKNPVNLWGCAWENRPSCGVSAVLVIQEQPRILHFVQDDSALLCCEL
jgi:hypothetical protein